MTLSCLFLALLIFIFLFWIFPSVLTAFLLFFGRCDDGLYLDKTYLEPFHEEFERSIDRLESFSPKGVTLPSRDGTSLFARWFYIGSSKTVILAHGFKASAYSNCCKQAEFFLSQGYNVLLIDQRAHGKSDGKAITFGLTEQFDFLDWLTWVHNNTSSKTVIAYGVSMGSAAVAYASAKVSSDDLQAMILDCGYSSPYEQMDNIAKEKHIPWKLMSPIVRLTVRIIFKCDLRDRVSTSLSKTSVPAFFIHGTEDEVVHCDHSKRNYSSCSSPKEFFLVEGAHHTTAFICGGDELKTKLLFFIDKYCPKEYTA